MIAMVPDTFPVKREFLYLFLLVLITVRVFVSVKRESRASTEDLEETFWLRFVWPRMRSSRDSEYDIYSSAPISFAQAALGGEVMIDTLDGKVVYEVKPGTQTDTRIRLRGKGIPSLRNKNMRGDHYVTLVVQVPTSLSHEAKETLRKFDDETGKTLKAGGTAVKEEKKKKGFMGKLKDAVDDL